MATYEVIVPDEQWTLISTVSCTFQADCNMHFAESVSEPLDMEVPNKEGLRDKIYSYTATEDEGLWAWASDGAIVTIDTGAMGITENPIAQAMNPNGGLDVNIQDQTTQVIDLYAFLEGGAFDLAVGVAIDDTQFTAVDASGMTIGDIVCFQEDHYFMQAIILDINVNLVTIDTPFDFAFTIAGGCTYGTKNLAVDGSVSPIVARVGPGNLADDVQWDIVRVLFSLTDQTSMDDAKFGGIPALTNGIILRTKNGITKNIFNVKTNGQFRLRNFDAEYTDRAPAGFFGFSSRRTFGGQSKNGVVLRLEAVTNDQIQIIIADDLTELDTFEVMIQGHMVD